MKDVLFLPDAHQLTLLDVEIDPSTELLILRAKTISPEAPCPVCQQSSARVQSRYTRILADLPCFGQPVRWRVQVRRFRCLNTTCPRQIFTERLPTCAPAYAHRTIRQAGRLQEVAAVLGGNSGARLAAALGMAVSRDTLLRLLKQSQHSLSPTPRVLGVDDFAWKKGDRYGTILIDLERHAVVDLLADREATTFAAWLRAHPGVEVISRDRAGAYADGARQGAPEAIQVSDRFHLLVNLRTTLQRLFERKHALLKRLAPPATPSIERTSYRRQAMSRGGSLKEAQRQARRERRYRRYESVLALHQQGLSQQAIAERVGVKRDTVHRYLAAPAFPEIVRPTRTSKLDDYKPYLRERWAAGQQNRTSLVAELRKRGYRGGTTIVYDYLRTIKQEAARKHAEPLPVSVGVALSAREAAWLFVRDPRRLSLRQVWQLDPLRTQDAELEQAYQLAQDFRMMVARRQPSVLERWLSEAKASDIPEFRSFAAGISRDYDAVQAALSREVSNGQTEGQVNRLKLIKRETYGRAHFDLLRLRVLHRSG
jgi:transposase